MIGWIIAGAAALYALNKSKQSTTPQVTGTPATVNPTVIPLAGSTGQVALSAPVNSSPANAAAITDTSLQNKLLLELEQFLRFQQGKAPASGGGGGGTSAATSGSGGVSYPVFGGGINCFSGDVQIKTPRGFVAFSTMPEWVVIENETGKHAAHVIRHEHFSGEVIAIDRGMYVTKDHLIRRGEGWLPASIAYRRKALVNYAGPLFDLHVESDREEDRHYILWNGDAAHNKPPLRP